jgi:lysozyme
MNISKEGIDLIKHFEGCRLEAYEDAVGVPTIAYGRIKDVKMGDSCTQAQAEAWLDEELHEYEGYINDAVTVALTQNQFDSLVSWVYNLGPSNLKSSTMLKVLNKEQYADVPEQIQRWNKAGGKVLEGLTKRRNAEALLFEGKAWT